MPGASSNTLTSQFFVEKISLKKKKLKGQKLSTTRGENRPGQVRL